MAFLDELKQRKVIRVAAAYVIAGWLALQFLDLVMENLNAPDWVMQAIMAVLAIGFPITLVLAWAFDISSDGLQVADSTSADSAASNRTFKVVIAGISLVILVGLGWAILRDIPVDEELAVPIAEIEAISVIDSIAVLPFENFSNNSSDAFFADGLADTLLNKLAQLRTLKVIARNSSFQFKGTNKDTREIGEILEVASLLEGSVQRDGERIRVITQLIDTSNGTHIWSETFDDNFENLFDLQDRIAQAILEKLQVAMSDRDLERVYRNGTENFEAYVLLMRARSEFGSRSGAAFDKDTDAILQLIQRALDLDPDYAQAWVLRSEIFNDLVWTGANASRSQEYLLDTRSSAEKAIETDPSYADGYLALGGSYWRAGNLREAEVHLSRALEMDPNNTGALSVLALVNLQRNEPARAYEYLLRVQKLDPQAVLVYRQLSFALYGLGRPEESLEMLKEGARRHPDVSWYASDLASIYIDIAGRPDEGARWASTIVARESGNLQGNNRMAQVWLAVGDLDRAAQWIERLGDLFPAAGATGQLTAMQETLAGSPREARLLIERFPETPDFLFDRVMTVAAACLMLGDAECLLSQAARIEQLLEMAEQNGSRHFAVDRYEISAAILKAAAVDELDGAQKAALEEILDRTENWPLVRYGGRTYRFTGYQRALIQSLLQRDAEAVIELNKTLELPDDGFLSDDFLGLPPDMNPLLTRLQQAPGYADWYREFSGRREQMRGTMAAMESRGEILSATDSSL